MRPAALVAGWSLCFPGKQQADIDAAFNRRNQRASLTAAWGAVSVGNIDGLLGGREGDRLHKREGRGGKRVTGDDLRAEISSRRQFGELSASAERFSDLLEPMFLKGGL